MMDASHILTSFRKAIKNFQSIQGEQIIRKAELENPWFMETSIAQSLEEWEHALTNDEINQWLSEYGISEIPSHQKNIGIIGAGNIPFVVMHDVLCALISGYRIHLKLSSEDAVLPKFWITQVEELIGEKLPITYVEKLNEADVIIATGSNNTHRYFEYYFRDKPSILRKSRSSVAVLPKQLELAQITGLGEDIFRYFGMGCRNVTQLWVPVGFEFAQLFETWHNTYQDLVNHHKYANNYNYHKALLLMNLDPHIDSGFVLFKERDSLHAPVGLVNFSYYKDVREVNSWLKSENEEIQCVLSEVEGIHGLSYGEAQKPTLPDYADNVDTLSWLLKQINQ